jgi:hypothetical protein
MPSNKFENQKSQDTKAARTQLRSFQQRFDSGMDTITTEDCERIIELCALVCENMANGISNSKSDLEKYAIDTLECMKSTDNIVKNYREG